MIALLADWPEPISGDSAFTLWRPHLVLCAEAEAIENFARWSGGRRTLFERPGWLIDWTGPRVPSGVFCRWSAGLKIRVWYDQERGGGYQAVDW